MKPTDAELEIAIIAAERLCETGTDEHHLGQCLIYLYQRLDQLDRVRAAAEDFLHSGQEDPQYDALVRAIEASREGAAQPLDTGVRRDRS
jgi:hypothetical protein